MRDKLSGCCVLVLCSAREEVGGQGAQVRTYALEPTEAIAVDVSFARSPALRSCRESSAAARWSASPPRSTAKSASGLRRSPKKHGIPYQPEAMGGRTGTNCDAIGVSRAGVRTGLISVPQRNMHTPAEVCDLADMENTARLIAAYI